MVLKDYEDNEWYEECAIIKNAINEYQKNLPESVEIPTHISIYRENKFQKMLEASNIIIEEKVAEEKATFIKLKLPVKNGL